MTVLAVIGATALYLLYVWLASAIICSWLSGRKGYGERMGLATGMLLSLVAIPLWLLWPAKPDSPWKLSGPVGRSGGSAAAARLEHES
jgi:hypothetical protein